MKINEKVAYIKGFAEGLEFDKTTKEGKLINQILEALEIISEDLEELKTQNTEIEEYLGDIDEDLAALEDMVYEGEEEEKECGCCHHFHGDDDFSEGDGSVVEITCPSCNEKIFVDSDSDLDNLKCPCCAENITVTTVSECGCGCEHE